MHEREAHYLGDHGLQRTSDLQYWDKNPFKSVYTIYIALRRAQGAKEERAFYCAVFPNVAPYRHRTPKWALNLSRSKFPVLVKPRLSLFSHFFVDVHGEQMAVPSGSHPNSNFGTKIIHKVPTPPLWPKNYI